ncbi:cation:proton antiporter [Candidatus Woesearchaeota archaeon]|nr:MAG: cation:proton antiporter [Candidatus Woesearchaeota archaeon]
MESIFIIAVCLTLSLILSEAFHALRYPKVIGQILAGIIVGIPFIKSMFLGDVVKDIAFLSDLGIVFLLLLAGLESNLHQFKKVGRDSVFVAVFSVAVPFIFGFFLTKLLGYSNIASLVVGASLSITAEGTTLVALMEMGVLKSRLGTIILGAGIIDDIFEIIFLAALLAIAHQITYKLALFPVLLILFVIISFVLIHLVPIIIRKIQREHSPIATFSTILVIGLVIAGISQLLGFGAILGAFVAGLIIQWANKNKKAEEKIVDELKLMIFAFIIPFFFINIGLHLDFKTFVMYPKLLIIILGVGIFAKIIAAFISKYFVKLSIVQTWLVGWAMNSRGAMELVLLEIARINNLMPIELYSAIVATAVITTLMFPLILRHVVRDNKQIMS